MRTAETIRRLLEQKLSPISLEIVDESHRHEGHSGFKPSGETHFNVTIVSEAFAGKSRVTRHRMVYEIVKEQMDAPVHALALSTLTPEEAALR